MDDPDGTFPSKVPVFYPSPEEFRDFYKYVQSIEPQCSVGLAKIVPPPGWKARHDGYASVMDSIVISKPVRQTFIGNGGIFQHVNMVQKNMTFREFEAKAATPEFAPPVYHKERPPAAERTKWRRKNKMTLNTILNDEATQSKPEPAKEPEEKTPKGILFSFYERKYWQNVFSRRPYYGADMLASLFSPDVAEFNLAHLPSLLDKMPYPVPGVNSPYLYFGMWASTFSWHVEDVDLYSINYLHFGAPKHWYVISPRQRKAFEEFAKSHFNLEHRKCSEFLRHKMSLISPSLLHDSNIQVNKVVQEENEFIITFPGAYHAGFNYGLNCAEAVNFALENWIPIGRKAKSCTCRKDSVRIDMSIFDEQPTEPEEDGGELEEAVSSPKSKRRKVKQEDDDVTDDPVDATSAKDTLPFVTPPDRCSICAKQQPGEHLLACRQCGILSHKDCFGFVEDKAEMDSFLCARCSEHLSKDTPCDLCPRMGGILKPTDHMSWCHRTCALWIPEVDFAHDTFHEFIIGIEKIPKARMRLLCSICKIKGGACIQCTAKNCTVSFHPSCAMSADYYMSLADPSTEAIESQCLCPTHDPRKREEKKALAESLMAQLHPGQRVWVPWGRERLYHPCTIEAVHISRPGHVRIVYEHDGGYQDISVLHLSILPPPAHLLAPPTEDSSDRAGSSEPSTPTAKRTRKIVDYSKIANGLV